MLTETKDINWVETLAQIAEDKHFSALGAYIRKFDEQPFPPAVYEPSTVVHYTPEEGVKEIVDTPIVHDYSKMNSKTFNITVMPEATCDGCQ